jgi:uncharacterized protein YbjT (DUF2867 family)
MSRVLLTGATGFVGRNVYPALLDAGYEVVCGTRKPRQAIRAQPGRHWARFDLNVPDTFPSALSGCSHVIYLVHGMADAGDYEQRERLGAERFAAAAARAGVERIVYLGGVVPEGAPSKHLRSRIVTGQILRSGTVSCVELQAGMIIGAGSESWRIVRDLAARLPAMVLPRWARSRSQPVAIDDVVKALLLALALPEGGSFALPGPEILTTRQILERVARLLGSRPFFVNVPVLSPRLSSYWLDLVTSADTRVARELIEGLRYDLVAADDGIWTMAPDHRLVSFDDAARRALEADEEPPSTSGRVLEAVARIVARKA